MLHWLLSTASEEKQPLKQNTSESEQLKRLEERVAHLERLLQKLFEEWAEVRESAQNVRTPSSEMSDIVETQSSGPEAVRMEDPDPQQTQSVAGAAEELKKVRERGDRLEAELADKEKEMERLKQEFSLRHRESEEAIQSLQAALNEAEAERVEWKRSERELLDKLAGMDARLESVRKEQERMAEDLALWQTLGLDEAQARNFARIFSSLAEPYREVVARYYNLDSCLIFACQCGVVARMRQCWESCRELALADQSPHGITDFLALIIQLYNHAFPCNPCRILAVEPGADFNYQSLDRVGAQGQKVRRMILPGFVMPNGSIGVKCLVELA